MAGLVSCVFNLILVSLFLAPNGPGVPVFGRCPYIILVRTAFLLSKIISLDIIILAQLWVTGEGPTIEWSYLRRKIMREKRLCYRGHGDCILLCAYLASWSRGKKLSITMSDDID